MTTATTVVLALTPLSTPQQLMTSSLISSTGVADSRNGRNKAGIGSDKLTSIESVIGSYYNDLLIGDSSENNIFDAESVMTPLGWCWSRHSYL